MQNYLLKLGEFTIILSQKCTIKKRFICSYLQDRNILKAYHLQILGSNKSDLVSFITTHITTSDYKHYQTLPTITYHLGQPHQ